MAARSTSSVIAGLARKIHPPNPQPKPTVCAAVRGNIADYPQQPLSRYSLFLLSI